MPPDQTPETLSPIEKAKSEARSVLSDYESRAVLEQVGIIAKMIDGLRIDISEMDEAERIRFYEMIKAYLHE